METHNKSGRAKIHFWIFCGEGSINLYWLKLAKDALNERPSVECICVMTVSQFREQLNEERKSLWYHQKVG